jgi:signal transduction histidine kinase
VKIALEFDPVVVRLSVLDDGVGMDHVPESSELLAGSHLGLLGMQERARMIGGSVRYLAVDPRGLQVLVEIPTTSVTTFSGLPRSR